MSGMVAEHFAITTWGMRNGKQLWRVSWDERPGMVADITGPYDTGTAFIKAYRVLDRLPWKAR